MAFSKPLMLVGALAALSGGLLYASQPAPEANPLSKAEAAQRLTAIASRFDASALVEPAKIVNCTLGGSTQTSCVSVAVRKAPERDDIGPWCPTNINDPAKKGGIWLDNGKVYDVDGAFVESLAGFYNDDFWQMFDPATGKINVTDSRESCDAAARPDVDPKYFNHCVECQPSYMEDGATATYVIPLRPVLKNSKGGRVSRGGAGLTFTGLRLDGPAPVDAILGAHTLAPFDDCGGHVNLHAGYHIHAVTGCHDRPPEASGHAAMIGVAMDGVAIHARLNGDGAAASDLDACGGHEAEAMNYHYHAAAPGDNAILGCHAAEPGCSLNDPNAACDASGGVLGRLRRLIVGK